MAPDDKAPGKKVSLEHKVGRAVLTAGVVLAAAWALPGYNAAKDYEAQLMSTNASNSSIVQKVEASTLKSDKTIISPEIGTVIYYATLPGRYVGYGVQMGRQLLDYIDIDWQ